MFTNPLISMKTTQLLDFDFLCDIIRDNDVDILAATFGTMLSFPDEADDSHNFYKLGMDLDAAVAFSKERKIPVAEVDWSKRGSHYDWIKELKEHLDDYIWLYNLLSDDLSKETLHRILLCRLLLNYSYWESTYAPLEYFDWSVLRKRKNAVYVDCGAYNGDSILEFFSAYGYRYQKIFAYEPSTGFFQTLKEMTAHLPNIEYRNCGVGETDGILGFSSQSNAGSHIVYDDGAVNTTVPIVSIDDDIQIPVSFIKMDIEGSERMALKGAKNHIINDKPQLAVCVYHLTDDLRTIPRLIHSYNPNQSFKLRNHYKSFTGELVFYADPFPSELPSKSKKLILKGIDELICSTEAISENLRDIKNKLQENNIEMAALDKARTEYRNCLSALTDMLDLY